jgi:hypothetical protein
MDPTLYGSSYGSTYGSTAMSPVVSIVYFLFMIALYVYFAYSLMVISKKTNTPHPWWSWVPILDMFQLIKAAGKSYWWILLFFVPIVNLFVAIYIWMEVARRRGFPNWWGILMIIPLVNLVIPGYLAFAEAKKK